MSGSRAVGYARVSTSDQADNGLSLTAQRAKIGAYATMHDLQLLDVIEDGGVSAKSLDRPGMARLLELIRRRQVDVVVIAKLDRITRSVRDLGELIDLFQRNCVEFASVADHIDTSTAAGRLVLNVMGSVAQWEREAIGERTREAMSVMRTEGRRISRFAPFGYRHNGRGLVEDEHEQRAITLMQRLRAEGRSLRRIAESLESQGFTNRRGGRLTAKVVADALRRAESVAASQ